MMPLEVSTSFKIVVMNEINPTSSPRKSGDQQTRVGYDNNIKKPIELNLQIVLLIRNYTHEVLQK